MIETTYITLVYGKYFYRGVATSMNAHLKQPHKDFLAAPELFKCETTIITWCGFLCRAIIQVATPRLLYLTRHIYKVRNLTVFLKFRHIFEQPKFRPS